MYGIPHGVYASARQRLVVLTFPTSEEAQEWDEMVDEERWLKITQVEVREVVR